MWLCSAQTESLWRGIDTLETWNQLTSLPREGVKAERGRDLSPSAPSNPFLLIPTLPSIRNGQNQQNGGQRTSPSRKHRPLHISRGCDLINFSDRPVNCEITWLEPSTPGPPFPCPYDRVRDTEDSKCPLGARNGKLKKHLRPKEEWRRFEEVLHLLRLERQARRKGSELMASLSDGEAKWWRSTVGGWGGLGMAVPTGSWSLPPLPGWGWVSSGG